MELGRLRWALLLLLPACAKPSVDTVPHPPSVSPLGYEEAGTASWVGQPLLGRRTARREVYDMSQMTAAHRTLPLGSRLIVESLLSGRTTEVRVTDRGPFTDREMLELSPAAARALGAVGGGVIPVRLRVVAIPGMPSGPRSGSFSVQVAAFTSEYRALVLKGILAGAWAGAHIQRAEAGGPAVYQVRVGTYSTRREARRVALRLAAAGYPVTVVED